MGIQKSNSSKVTVPDYLSVTELNMLLNSTLEEAFPQIKFQGEISGITRAGSGHLYFSVKDPASPQTCQVSVVMWRGVAQSLDFKIEEGSAVLCHGRPNVYVANGRLQLIVHKMLRSGEGLLQQRYLELQAKLEAEGIFSQERKRKLPFLPRAVGVVTSGTGAVIHDIMVKIRERMPNLIVYLADVRVQGEGAAQEIADAVQRFNQSGLVDVIIIARGGGSLQDLWAFNEEVVVRSIFASKIPTISGVGHEVDVTLCDLVADERAPTPTAAAERVVPKREDLLRRIELSERRLFDLERWFRPLEQRVDDLDKNLLERIERRLANARLLLARSDSRLASIEPSRLLASLRGRLELAGERLYSIASRRNTGLVVKVDKLGAGLVSGVRFYMEQSRSRLDRSVGKLDALSPYRVLERGFAIIEKNGSIIKSASDLSVGDETQINFYDGTVRAIVNSAKGKDAVEDSNKKIGVI